MAPLVMLDSSNRPRLVAPVTLVANGSKTLAVTSAERVRPLQGMSLAVITKLDGSAMVPIASWTTGRYSGLGLLELAGPVPADHDVTPLSIGAVCATSDTRGAPAGLVSILSVGAGYERALIAVHVDADDAGGMSDTVIRLVSPIDATQPGLAIEGSPLFAWFPPEPALGRPGEVLVTALAFPYRARTARPRANPVIAELVGLDDLGRALISVPAPDARPELAMVAGEIVDKADPRPDSGD